MFYEVFGYFIGPSHWYGTYHYYSLLKLAKKDWVSSSDPSSRSIKHEDNNDEESMMSKEEISFLMNKFFNYEISVDGANWRLKITAIIKTLSDKNIRHIAIKKSVKSVWQGKHRRDIPVHISQRAKIWPLHNSEIPSTVDTFLWLCHLQGNWNRLSIIRRDTSNEGCY